MRFIATFVASFITLSSVSAQEVGAKIAFESETHDYGTIKQGTDGGAEFVFTNGGTEPLVISNAKGSCGCTVPEWPKEPIAPGASGSIKVMYDTKRVGNFQKTVTVTSNGSEVPLVLKIQGVVEEVPGFGAEEHHHDHDGHDHSGHDHNH